MALPVTVPNQFATATASIPLSQLDANFSTLANAINGIGNGTENVAASLKGYKIQGSDLGTTSGNVTIELVTGNFFSATTNANTTWSFANATAANTLSCVVLTLTNGGGYTQTWTDVDWPGGTAPTLTAAGVDQLVFTTRDGGTTYFGFVAGLDIKSP